MLTCFLGLSLIVLHAGSVSDVHATAANDMPPPATSAQSVPDFNFNLLSPETQAHTASTALNPQLTHAVAKRRSMLQTHQVLGLTTLGLMAATVVLGQLNYNDLYTPNGGHTGDFLIPHRIGAYATTAAFITTASFSLLAPTPYRTASQGVDTATLHKVAVGVASTGMLAQVVLGFITARSADAGNSAHLASFAKAHQIIGYSTLGAMTTAAAIWIF